MATTRPPGRWDGFRLSLRIAGTLLVVVAVGVAWSAWSTRDPVPAAAASRYADSIAVVPLDNRTDDPALDGLGQSIADEVIRHLSTSPLKVIDTYSVVSLWDERLGMTRLLDTLEACWPSVA